MAAGTVTALQVPGNHTTHPSRQGKDNHEKRACNPISLVLLTGVATTTLSAEGGQKQGDVGQGETDQGDTGSETGNAQGADALGNIGD